MTSNNGQNTGRSRPGLGWFSRTGGWYTFSPVLSNLQPFGVLLAVGIVLGLLVSDRIARAEGLDRALGASAFVTAGIAALAGARLVYVLGSPVRESALEVLALGRGGLSGYGALGAGSAVFAWAVARGRDPVWAWLDAAAPGLLLCAAVARLGCLLAGCDFGVPGHPTQLYEAALLIALSAAGVIARAARRRNGQIFAGAVVAYALLRFGLEPLRADLDRGVFRALTLTQWCAIASLAAVAAAWARRQRLPSSI